MNWPFAKLSWIRFLSVEAPFLPYLHCPGGVSLCVFGTELALVS